MVEQIAFAEQGLGTDLIENGAGIDTTLDTESNAGREVCLDQTRHDIHGRALSGDHQMNPGRPRFLGQASDELFSGLAKPQDQVGILFDEANHIGQDLPFTVELDIFTATSRADGLIELLNISSLEGEHHLIASLHLRHQPVEDGFGVGFNITDHRAGQVGQLFVRRQFNHLGVDEHEPHFLRTILADQPGDEVIDKDAFA